MAEFLIVGSGATGVHFALTALDRGHSVTMLDVGFEKPAPVAPEATFQELKQVLDDPESYFLGARGESVVFPAPTAKPYGFPSSKEYVFRRPAGFGLEERGFQPMLSFARGGLAEAWTGGSYELRDVELDALGIDRAAMRAAYRTVSARIGIGAVRDDLERFSPYSADYQEPLELDPHSRLIMSRYERSKARVNALGAYLGRSRVAVLSRAVGDRQPCDNLGRCLWGCPRNSLYAPGQTLRELITHPRFTYCPGRLVRRVTCAAGGKARGVVSTALDGTNELEHRAERIILAAGALASTRIYLETLASQGVKEPVVTGVMDNGHVMIPFVNPSRFGADVDLAAYQFHMLALGIDTGDWRHDAHAQITTLKAASVHPIVNNLPFDLRTSLRVFQRIRGGLGVANLWLSDERRVTNVARLDQSETGTRLVLEYSQNASDVAQTRAATARVRKALGMLGCIAPPWMCQVLPRGSSVHYAGTLPLQGDAAEHTVSPAAEVRGFEGLHVVDGAVLSWLPAKNVTFSLMANAVRFAELIT